MVMMRTLLACNGDLEELYVALDWRHSSSADHSAASFRAELSHRLPGRKTPIL
jgi:hypothetical protein